MQCAGHQTQSSPGPKLDNGHPKTRQSPDTRHSWPWIAYSLLAANCCWAKKVKCSGKVPQPGASSRIQMLGARSLGRANHRNTWAEILPNRPPRDSAWLAGCAQLPMNLPVTSLAPQQHHTQWSPDASLTRCLGRPVPFLERLAYIA